MKKEIFKQKAKNKMLILISLLVIFVSLSVAWVIKQKPEKEAQIYLTETDECSTDFEIVPKSACSGYFEVER